MELIRQYKPALIFLGKFLAVYFSLNVLYGIYVNSYGQQPDPWTRAVTAQTSFFLRSLGYPGSYLDSTKNPVVYLLDERAVVLTIFEGCNGLNVLIVFLAFLVAFGPLNATALGFALIGTGLIHVTNLGRLILLYWLAISRSTHFYFFHKYVFTASLYVLVFLLWFIWIVRINGKLHANSVG